ncbi:17962_t:CDS:1, partial [Gigaspora rosea]
PFLNDDEDVSPSAQINLDLAQYFIQQVRDLYRKLKKQIKKYATREDILNSIKIIDELG